MKERTNSKEIWRNENYTSNRKTPGEEWGSSSNQDNVEIILNDIDKNITDTNFENLANEDNKVTEIDQKILQEVLKILDDPHVDDYTSVQVEVREGDILLSGTVNTKEERINLANRIGQINQVGKVVNQITQSEK